MQIAANIKTFERPEKFRKTLEHALDAGIKEINIGFDGGSKYLEKHKVIIDKAKENHRDANIEFYKFRYNKGLSYVRNKLIEKTDAELIFQLDDDIYISKHNVESAGIFKEMKLEEIGGIGFGWVTPFNIDIDAHNINIKDGWYLRDVTGGDKRLEWKGHFYILPFDFIPTSGIYKKELFDDVKYDENYIINREHEDFFLQIKTRNLKWKFMIDVSSYVFHDIGGSEDYMKKRHGELGKKSSEYFNKKWGLKGILGNPWELTKYLDRKGYSMYAYSDYIKKVHGVDSDTVDKNWLFWEQ